MGVKKLTPQERDEIARLHSKGSSIRGIARHVGRSPSTISSELKAGVWNDNNVHKSVYVAIHAQSLRDARSKGSNKKNKLLTNTRLRAYIETKIRYGWSPEQISGRLPLDYPDDNTMRIGHEAIYRYIYAPEQANERFWEYLPRKQKKRRKQTGRSAHRTRIPDRVSISERPEEINNRTEFGHWEGDSVEGLRSVGDGIHTEVERLSRKLLAKKVARIASEETSKVQIDMFTKQPEEARKTTTLDNGKENKQHMTLKAIGMKVYFADPYSSWQRGTNENTNGLIRRYLPKRTDFTYLSQSELDDIVHEINSRPRKVLGYKTPDEVYLEQLLKC